MISFDSPKGPLRFACDKFDRSWKGIPAWQQNLRAIALGLEALRKIDRYGIASSGEQYRGFTAIGSGTPMPPVQITRKQAASILRDLAGDAWVHPDELIAKAAVRATAYRQAVKRAHPDSGGSKEAFQELQDAKAQEVQQSVDEVSTPHTQQETDNEEDDDSQSATGTQG